MSRGHYFVRHSEFNKYLGEITFRGHILDALKEQFVPRGKEQSDKMRKTSGGMQTAVTS